MSEEFHKALTKARLDLLRKPKAVFVSTLVLMMKQKMDETIPTAATDGLTIYYNPTFFLSKTREERVTLLAHEAMHPALQHLDRSKHLDHDRYNRAGDYVINDFLVLAGFKPIANWLHNEKYRGMTTMEVYNLLAEDEPDESIGDWGDLKPKGEGDPDKTPAEVESQIRTMVATAAQATQMRGADAGGIPADVQVFLDGLLKPKLPMAAHLKRFFQQFDKSDYSWKTFNRRFAPMLLPGLRGQKLTHIAFAFDMSASVSDADTKRYVTELHHVMRTLRPDKITLVQFDTCIKSVNKIRNVQELANVELRGRGGTCIEPLMEWAHKEKPTALIVFTDGEYRHPDLNPRVPILWMIHGNSKDRFRCNFGTTIRFDV